MVLLQEKVQLVNRRRWTATLRAQTRLANRHAADRISLTVHYEGRIFRPPSEADAILLQVTVGCSHNGCRFCAMYREKRFRIKTRQEILCDIAEASVEAAGIGRVSYAMVMPSPCPRRS